MCININSHGVGSTRSRSSECAVFSDRVIWTGGCEVGWEANQATLPTGRYLKVGHNAEGDFTEIKVCEVQVFGVSVSGNKPVPTSTAKLTQVKFANEISLQTEFNELGFTTTKDFTIHIHGEFEISEIDSGEYIFNIISSDGSVLYIDGKLIVSNDGLHAMQSASAAVQLSEGVHKLEILHFKAYEGYPGLVVQWQGGPHDFKRQVFQFSPNWSSLRNHKANQDCSMVAPELSSSAVPIRYGQRTAMRPVGHVCLVASRKWTVQYVVRRTPTTPS